MKSDDLQLTASMITPEQLSLLKQADRTALEALPPDEAQAAVDQILPPRLWRLVDSQPAWPGEWDDDDAP